jgi:YcxB-like protein
VGIGYSITEEEFLEGLRVYVMRLRGFRGRYASWIFVPFGATTAIIGVISLLYLSRHKSAAFIGLAVGLFVVWSSTWSGGGRWRGKRWFRKNREVYQHIELAFGEEGLHLRQKTIENRTLWARYRSFTETRNLILLQNPVGLTILPKRAFAPPDLDALKALLEKNVKRATR